MKTYREIEIALGLPARSSYWIERNAIRKLWRLRVTALMAARDGDLLQPELEVARVEAPIGTDFEGRDRAALEQAADARGMDLKPGRNFCEGQYLAHSIGLDRDDDDG